MAKRKKPEPVKIYTGDHDKDREKIIAAARTPGGVTVYDLDGNREYHAYIPQTDIRL